MSKPIFARQHYEALARFCAELAVNCSYDETSTQTSLRMRNMLEDDNPKFKRVLFGKRIHEIIVKLDPNNHPWRKYYEIIG